MELNYLAREDYLMFGFEGCFILFINDDFTIFYKLQTEEWATLKQRPTYAEITESLNIQWNCYV